MDKFSIGDVVIPYWSPSENLFICEVVGFDGIYVLCKSMTNDLMESTITYLTNEIKINKELSRDNKLKKLCN